MPTPCQPLGSGREPEGAVSAHGTHSLGRSSDLSGTLQTQRLGGDNEARWTGSKCHVESQGERAVRAEANAVQRLHGGSMPAMREELDKGQGGKRWVWEALERWAGAIWRTWQVSKESKGGRQ